jgi:hypothetical protein
MLCKPCQLAVEMYARTGIADCVYERGASVREDDEVARRGRAL